MPVIVKFTEKTNNDAFKKIICEYSQDETDELGTVSSQSQSDEDDAESTSEKLIEYRLGITINHPRDKYYVHMTQTEQRTYMRRCFLNFLKSHPIWVRRSEHAYFFEECKDGMIHLHAEYKIYTDREGSIAGLVVDYARMLARAFPKVKHCIDMKKYNIAYSRYTSPFMCLQYYDNNDKWIEWCKYIRKDQYKGLL